MKMPFFLFLHFEDYFDGLVRLIGFGERGNEGGISAAKEFKGYLQRRACNNLE